VAVLSGCSDGQPTFPTGEVSGTVTYQGERISQGQIKFISKDTGNFATAAIKDGSYTVKAPLGMCKIEIQVQSTEIGAVPPQVPPQLKAMVEAKKKEMRDKGMQVPDELPQGTKGAAINLPDKYKSADTSGLEFEVKAGTQTKEWDLH
jgi:hypothetical protein